MSQCTPITLYDDPLGENVIFATDCMRSFMPNRDNIGGAEKQCMDLLNHIYAGEIPDAPSIDVIIWIEIDYGGTYRKFLVENLRNRSWPKETSDEV